MQKQKVENIKNWLDNDYNHYSFEYIVSAIDNQNNFIEDYFKSYDDIELAINYAKELYQFLKEQKEEFNKIIIEFEITGWQKEYKDPETVMSTIILEYTSKM